MFKHYVKRAIRKIVAIPLFIIFTFTSLIAKPLSALLRITSLPCSVLAVIVAAVTFFNGGSLNITLQILVISGLFAAVYAAVPYFPAFIFNVRHNLKETVRRPIVIRPPVRFTM